MTTISQQMRERGWRADIKEGGLADQVENLERQLTDAATNREILEGRLTVARNRLSELSGNVMGIKQRYDQEMANARQGIQILHEVALHLAKDSADSNERASILAELLEEAVGSNIALAIEARLLSRRAKAAQGCSSCAR